MPDFDKTKTEDAKADAAKADAAEAKADAKADAAEKKLILDDKVFVPQSLKDTAEGIARENQAKADYAAKLDADATADAKGAENTNTKDEAQRRWDKAMTEAQDKVEDEAKKDKK